MSELPAPIKALLTRPGLADLGPGPRSGVICVADIDVALAPWLPLPGKGALVRALVLLWNDHHDLAHGIVQDLSNKDGSLIHAILHRREPDYSNAGYWFHRVGQHPCYPTLAERVVTLASSEAASGRLAALIRRGAWDPMAFVAACEEVESADSDTPLVTRLRQIQAMETESLLQHLVRAD